VRCLHACGVGTFEGFCRAAHLLVPAFRLIFEIRLLAPIPLRTDRNPAALPPLFFLMVAISVRLNRLQHRKSGD